MGNFWRALRTVFLPKTGDLLGGTVKNTGRLLRMFPLVFRELSWAFVRFYRVVVWLFVHITSSENMMIFHQKSSNIPYFWPQFWRSYFWPSGENWLAAPKIKPSLWRNGKLFKKALGKLRGASWGVYRGFLPSRRVNRWVFDQKTQFFEPLNFFP